MSNTPAICYENLFESASTVTASSEATDFDKENAYDWRTFDFWKPTAGGTSTLTADLGSTAPADFGGIYAHDLHTQGATIKLQYSSDNFAADINDAFSVTPTTSAPIVRTFASQSARYWRYEITGAAAAQSIGVLAFGARLDMQTGLRPGFSPPPWARVPVLHPHQAEQGAILGLSVRRRGVAFSAGFTALTAAWFRSNWPAVQDHIETKPFFLTWDPTNYPDEAVFCWVDGAPAPPVYQTPTRVSLALKLNGLML